MGLIRDSRGEEPREVKYEELRIPGGGVAREVE